VNETPCSHEKPLKISDGKLVAELSPLLSPSPDASTPGLDAREHLFAGIGNDLRQAVRLLRLNPGFATVAILSGYRRVAEAKARAMLA
jgi:hypothetical protein